MPAIDLDYLVGSAAIDIFVMLAISVGIPAEMRCDNPPYRRMAIKRWQSPGHQTLTICDRTREPSGSKLISSRLKLANVGDPPASSDLGPGAGRRTREGPARRVRSAARLGSMRPVWRTNDCALSSARWTLGARVHVPGS